MHGFISTASSALQLAYVHTTSLGQGIGLANERQPGAGSRCNVKGARSLSYLGSGVKWLEWLDCAARMIGEHKALSLGALGALGY